ncbi:hypothetical protein BKA70DRAFT_1267312 [Coprinopsis sp. MPI-PUGE-AT-0042]|nr:hypothetical protein BKA70DRAFT_1267312 [Coprinopsis sp. MPI-PUGE-AT-0042]
MIVEESKNHKIAWNQEFKNGKMIGVTRRTALAASHQISLFPLDRPPTLEHYLGTNDALSPSDLSALEGYLAHLSERIENLESDTGKLDDLCVNTKSSIRKIPPELLGIIFAFAVSTAPFNQFIDVAHLRGVCSSWREAALSTPGIWTDLTIDLDKWCSAKTYDLDAQTRLRRFESDLKPWLAILTRKPSYHLTLTMSQKMKTAGRKEQAPQMQLAQCLFSSSPQPGAITLESPHAVFGIGLLDTSVGLAFPDLKALDVWIPLLLEPGPLFRHTSLLTLDLRDLMGPGEHLQQLIQEFPSLRELKLSSTRYIKTGEQVPIKHTHHSLEKLILDGEDFLFAFSHTSFPSLRVLVIHGHQFTAYDDETPHVNIFAETFSRSSTQPLLVALRGGFYPEFLTRLIQSLPPNSHLLFDTDEEDEDSPYNVEAIFCGRNAVDLSWLQTLSRSLPIYLPTGFEDWEAGYSRQDQLRRHGFELEPVSNESAGSILRSLAPCELLQNLL